MNKNGEVLRLQIDTTGKLLNATIIAKADAIIQAINDQSNSLAERLNALTLAVQTGLADIKVEIDKNTGAIKFLEKTTKNGLAQINTTLVNGFTELNTKIDNHGKRS